MQLVKVPLHKPCTHAQDSEAYQKSNWKQTSANAGPSSTKLTASTNRISEPYVVTGPISVLYEAATGYRTVFAECLNL